jgi:N-carbamoyl-L-amino-acid hydrolase
MTIEINPARLWKDIIESGEIGATEKGGVCRLALSDEDRRVREWFVEACRAEGCEVRFDELGNLFARRQGRRPDLLPIAIGSHLDTQPTGGKFDGILGVLAGLEVVRTLNEHGIGSDFEGMTSVAITPSTRTSSSTSSRAPFSRPRIK